MARHSSLGAMLTGTVISCNVLARSTKRSALTMSENARRQREFRARRIEAGFQPITIWVPAEHASDFKVAADKVCEDRNLSLGPLRNVVTGKLQRRA